MHCMHYKHVSQSILSVGRLRDKSVGASWERGRRKNTMEAFWYVHSLKLYPRNFFKVLGIQHKEEWRSPCSCVEDWWENDTCMCVCEYRLHLRWWQEMCLAMYGECSCFWFFFFVFLGQRGQNVEIAEWQKINKVESCSNVLLYRYITMLIVTIWCQNILFQHRNIMIYHNISPF